MTNNKRHIETADPPGLALFAIGRLMKFDIVVANPPFSLDKWGADKAAADPYGRFHRGIPPKSRGDYAFITHMIEAAAAGSGRVGVIVPHGVLFRSAAEGRIRQTLIEENLLEAVIGLPVNLFYGTGNRGIAGELILRRAEKLKNRFGDDVRIGRFAGFDLFLRPSFNNTVEVVVRGKNSYAARVTDTALGTIRSLEATVQGFEERATKLETDIADAQKRTKELETKVGAPFEKEEHYQHQCRRQSEIEEQLDLTKNQAPSQVEAESTEAVEQKKSEHHSQNNHHARPARRVGVHV